MSADVVLDRLEKDFTDWTFIPPRGGYSVWVTLPGDVSADAFVQAAGLQGKASRHFRSGNNR